MILLSQPVISQPMTAATTSIPTMRAIALSRTILTFWYSESGQNEG
jgi:hypothetical protein